MTGQPFTKAERVAFGRVHLATCREHFTATGNPWFVDLALVVADEHGLRVPAWVHQELVRRATVSLSTQPRRKPKGPSSGTLAEKRLRDALIVGQVVKRQRDPNNKDTDAAIFRNVGEQFNVSAVTVRNIFYSTKPSASPAKPSR